MKKILFNVVGALIILAAIAGVVIVALSDDPIATDVGNNGGNTTFPEPGAVTQPLPDQTLEKGTQPDIAKALIDQAPAFTPLTTDGTVISSVYALQLWGSEGGGGTALLVYTPEKGWVVRSLGGGSPSVGGLMILGVPEVEAKKLMEGLGL